jgi:peptide/nickel transport system substrate-binding protein
MMRQSLIKYKGWIFTPLILVLVFIAACGSAAPPPQEQAQKMPQQPAAQMPAQQQQPAAQVPAQQQQPTAQPTKAPTKQADVLVFNTPVPTPAPVSKVPDWVSIGASKHYKGDFPFIATFNPGFWDVHYGGSLNTVLVPSGPRFNQLLEYDPVKPTEIIGDLAKTWELSDDGKVYTFRLHDAKFSDGSPVTADDVVFSLDRITLPGALRARTGWLNGYYQHKTATAIDPKTVRVPLKFSAGAFIPNLAADYMKIYPKALEKLSQDDFNCCPEKSFGSGPWVFRNWKKDASWSYDKNPHYFKKGRPFFDGMQVFIVQDVSRMIAALTAGQAYATYQPVSGGNRPKDMAKLEEDTKGRVRAVEISGASLQGIWMNISKPPFDNPKVRRAMHLALDRQQGVDRAVLGFGLPGTFFAPGVVEHVDALTKTSLAYQRNRSSAIAEAKKLLAEAGYPNGFKVTINTVNTAPSLPAAEVFSAQMRQDLGIEVTLSPKDLATMYVEMRDGVHNLDNVGTGLILRDPGDVLNQWYARDVLRNPHNWENPRVTELINLQNREPNQEKRLSYIKEISDILQTGEGHFLPYFWYTSGGALDYRLRNYYPPPTVQLAHKWDHVWWDPDRPMPQGKGYQP